MTSHFHTGALFHFFEFLSTLVPYSAAKINFYLKTRICLFPTSVPNRFRGTYFRGFKDFHEFCRTNFRGLHTLNNFFFRNKHTFKHILEKKAFIQHEKR